MKYKVVVPATMEQGSYETIAEDEFNLTMKQHALWDYNSAREHDGFPPLRRMPKGTKYIPLEMEE